MAKGADGAEGQDKEAEAEKLKKEKNDKAIADKAALARDKSAEAMRKKQADAAAKKEKDAGAEQETSKKEQDAEELAKIKESREALKHPIPPGMVAFEAPDGLIVLAEMDRPHVPERRQGKPWKTINPMRGASRRA